jgi:hypothetical protein
LEALLSIAIHEFRERMACTASSSVKLCNSSVHTGILNFVLSAE